MQTIPNWLDTSEYPFRHHFMDITGHSLHYIDEGAGDVILFVHGTPSWSFDFRHIITSLSKQYRCIAIDHIGFGMSDKPTGYDYSTIGHSKTLERFILSQGLKDITMVVHDFGGPIGFDVAIRHPGLIKNIVVLNSWLWSDEEEPDFIKFSRILKSPLLPFLYTQLNFSPRFLLPRSFGDKQLKKRELRQYIKPFSKQSERKGPLAFARSLLNDQQWFESLWEKRNILQDKPVLFVWGMKDRFVTERHLLKFATGFPNSTICKIETAGHFPQEEEPMQVTTVIEEFLLK